MALRRRAGRGAAASRTRLPALRTAEPATGASSPPYWRRPPGHNADIHPLRPTRVRHSLETGQPEQVVDEAAHALALVIDAREGALVPVPVARLRQGERRLRLDHREGRAELVRRVGSEIHLSPACLLDRRGDSATDG